VGSNPTLSASQVKRQGISSIGDFDSPIATDQVRGVLIGIHKAFFGDKYAWRTIFCIDKRIAFNHSKQIVGCVLTVFAIKIFCQYKTDQPGRIEAIDNWTWKISHPRTARRWISFAQQLWP
jgi:hypothetical protein